MNSSGSNKGWNSEEDAAMELRIWEYIDGLGTTAERSGTERLLLEHAAWREKYNELLAVHSMLGAADLEQPSMRFTRNVMDEIARFGMAPAAKAYLNKKVIWGIAAFFITIIAGFLVYGLSQVAWTEGSANKGIAGIDFAAVDYSRMFNNKFVNAFMTLNIILALVLLDRYLAGRRRSWRQA